MQPQREFRRFASDYGRYSLIQDRVAKALAGKIGKPFARVVDLGCGSGGFFRAYEHPFTRYLAVDISDEMLELHPEAPGVVKMRGDFDDPELFSRLAESDFDLLVSSSALQWSRDLDLALRRIAALGRPSAFAIFTSGTFRELHDLIGTASPIRSSEAVERLLKRYFDLEVGKMEYRLYFKDRLSMLRYIKRSGVSGGRKVLGYRDTKEILREYPLPYLTFEVVSAVGIPRRIYLP